MSGKYDDPGFYQDPFDDLRDDDYGYDQSQPLREKTLSGYVKGWVITDVVFCSLRAIFVILGIVGFMTMAKNDPIRNTAIFEIISGIGIAIFGLAGNIMILNRNYAGVALGWVNVAFTVMSIIVGIWQSSIIIKLGAANPAFQAGGVFGLIIGIIIRLTLLGFYISALVMANSQLSSNVRPRY